MNLEPLSEKATFTLAADEGRSENLFPQQNSPVLVVGMQFDPGGDQVFIRPRLTDPDDNVLNKLDGQGGTAPFHPTKHWADYILVPPAHQLKTWLKNKSGGQTDVNVNLAAVRLL